MKNLQSPHIHLNGTSKNELLDNLCDASCAMEDAIEALKPNVPNGRDYYPLGPEAMKLARNQHDDRLKRLHAIKSELDYLAEAVADQ